MWGLFTFETRSGTLHVGQAGERLSMDFPRTALEPAEAIGDVLSALGLKTVDEDPCTGSMHCALGPLWAERLGKTRLYAEQVSKRGGRLEVEVGESRVQLIGQAVTVLAGSLR